MSGEITATDAVKDIVKDVGLAGAAGYGTGFVEGVVANSMRASGHEMLSKMGKAGIPAAAITFAVESHDITSGFCSGRDSASEYAYELGKNVVSTAGGVAGAAICQKYWEAVYLEVWQVPLSLGSSIYYSCRIWWKVVQKLIAKAQEMADKA